MKFRRVHIAIDLEEMHMTDATSRFSVLQP